MLRPRWAPRVLQLLVALGATIAVSAAAEIDEALFQAFQRLAPRLDERVLLLALQAAGCADLGKLADGPSLTIIDYSLPSTEPRLWVFDLERRKLLFRELVAHGVNTDDTSLYGFRTAREVGSRA